MLDKTVDGIEYWAINSDHQALSRSKAKGAKTLSIGATVTRGLGAGGDPAKGQLAAEENMAELAEIVEGADLVFITAGMVRCNDRYPCSIHRSLCSRCAHPRLVQCLCLLLLVLVDTGRRHRIGSGAGRRSNGPVRGCSHHWDCHETICL